MKKKAIKLVLAISAASQGDWFPNVEEKINKIKIMNEDELKQQIERLENIFRLVMMPILKEPNPENLEIVEEFRRRYPNANIKTEQTGPTDANIQNT